MRVYPFSRRTATEILFYLGGCGSTESRHRGAFQLFLVFFFFSLSFLLGATFLPWLFVGLLLFITDFFFLLERIRTRDLCNLAGEIGVERRQVTRQSSPISTGETSQG